MIKITQEVSKLPDNFTGMAEFSNGYKAWYLNGNLHREGGPASEYPNWSKEWYLNGYLHREDGPAVEFSNGHKEWWINGKLHREDGPAVEVASGTKKWFVNGEELTEADFNSRQKDPCSGKVVEIEGKKYTLTPA